MAVSNRAGLGRLARISIIALASQSDVDELHVYLRSGEDLQLLEQECDRQSAGCLERLILHYPPFAGINRLVLEELLMPNTFSPLELDAFLGLDFTLPRRQLAGIEAVIIPDLIPFNRPQSVSWRARWLYRRGITLAIRRNARLICISGSTQSALTKRFPGLQSVRTIYPALSPRLLSRALKMHDARNVVQVRGSCHGFVTSQPYLLGVGVLGPRKNTELLVSSFRELISQGGYSGSLVLVGGDGRFHNAEVNSRLALETAGPSLKRSAKAAAVYDIGQVTDNELSDLYRCADLLVSFSAEEGFGYPVLESLAHGTPALVTSGSPMMEIADGGIASTGLNPARRLNALTSAIQALPLLRRETNKLDLENYSVSRLGAELMAVLQGG